MGSSSYKIKNINSYKDMANNRAITEIILNYIWKSVKKQELNKKNQIS